MIVRWKSSETMTDYRWQMTRNNNTKATEGKVKRPLYRPEQALRVPGG
jgi:hypothetical protein